MKTLNELKSLFSELYAQQNAFNQSLLQNGPSITHSSSFLSGEFNLKNESVLKAINIIKNQRNPQITSYISSALSYYFKSKIIHSQKVIESFKNDYKQHKRLPEWNDKFSICYESMINTEMNEIAESTKMLSTKTFQDIVSYFNNEASKSCIFENQKALISDMDFFRSNYSLFKIVEVMFEFYCFEKSFLDDFKPKSNPLFDFLMEREIDILSDKNYYKYGLITLTDEYEPIATEHLECRLYNKTFDFTISLLNRMNNQLFKDFINLYNQGLVKELSFRPIFETPISGKFTNDMALEAVEFGKIFDTNFSRLILSKLVAENKDAFWVIPEQNSITFEELLYDFETFSDYVVTQMVHLIYFQQNNSYYIEHIDHEIIFYTLDEYTSRLNGIKTDGIANKGKEKCRQKTFEISHSAIPFLSNGKPEFLIKVLYTFFIRKELLNEYFEKYR